MTGEELKRQDCFVSERDHTAPRWKVDEDKGGF